MDGGASANETVATAAPHPEPLSPSSLAAGGGGTSQISLWILEFVLRQPIENWLAHELIAALPLPSPRLPSALYTTVLLRRIASLLSCRTFTYRILETMELLHSLSSKPHPPSLAPAYAAAALHVAAKVLRHGDGEAFCEVADVLFRGHIGRLVRSGMAEGLVSAELVEVKGLAERAAAGDTKAGEAMLEMDSEDELIDKLRTLLNDSAIRMGPSFLELAAQAVIGSGIGGALVDLAEKYSTMMETGVEFAPELRKFDPLPTPMVTRVQEALKTSCEELQRVVYDPLMEAVAIATSVHTDRRKEREENKNQESGANSSFAFDKAKESEKQPTITGVAQTRDQDTALLSSFVPFDQQNQKQFPGNNNTEHGSCPRNITDNAVENSHKEGTSNHGLEKNKQTAHHSFMDWNPTAQTHEWDDSTDTFSQGSPNKPRKLFLPSPNKRTVSPLKLLENQKFLRRRRVKKWSAEEEDVLREAVKKHGKGNWKIILNIYSDVFQERTEVDLKDKWRNMTRY